MPVPRRRRFLVRSLALLAASVLADVMSVTAARAQDPATPAAPWYERFRLRGYAQLRYNRLLESNPDLTCAACDRSIGDDNGFFLRRARLTIGTDPTPRTSLQVEIDYAAETAGQPHTLQLRTAFADVFLDDDHVHRLRFGQAKLPFGFETVQSSSRRLALDRSDAINSAVPNERDLGVFWLWSPRQARLRFEAVADAGLKGSGDYGVLNVGVYNGQGANRAEENDNLHAIARLAWPFRLPSGQFLEIGVQGYHGRFIVTNRSPGVTGPTEFEDERAAFSAVLYPQPLGIQVEWNVGTGPEFDPAAGAIRAQRLDGGYIQLMYRARRNGHEIVPFVRYQFYDGGRKAELDARAYRVREAELGLEWTPASNLELTVQYTISNRRMADAAQPDNRQRGELLRLQGQISY